MYSCHWTISAQASLKINSVRYMRYLKSVFSFQPCSDPASGYFDRKIIGCIVLPVYQILKVTVKYILEAVFEETMPRNTFCHLEYPLQTFSKKGMLPLKWGCPQHTIIHCFRHQPREAESSLFRQRMHGVSKPALFFIHSEGVLDRN